MKLNDLNLEEYEIVPEPIPENETPRQRLLRMTGYDFSELDNVTWEIMRESPEIEMWFGKFIARFYKPKFFLKKKNQ